MPHDSPSSEVLSVTKPLGTSSAAYWVLRIGAALCFIGHGAFGFITKAAWIPYFGVVGIPERWAWAIMPWVGAVDVLAGMAVLFAPRALPLVYMVIWACWTALLRPLAGESVFQTIERAGNYGVPLAFLLITALPISVRELVTRLDSPSPNENRLALARETLKWTTALLLFGHGALGAVTGTPLLAQNYAAVGLPESTEMIIGWFEMTLAGAVLWRPATRLILFVAAWKLMTESLFIAAGAPIWEFVERAGSFAAPLALAILTSRLVAWRPDAGEALVAEGSR
jgi:hypothetical protein